MVHLVDLGRRVRVALLFAAALLAACSAAPPDDEVRRSVQAQLDAALGGRVLAITRFTPAGGAPLSEGDGRLVYFNARLTLERDYDFTRWDAHNVASLASLLGAGPKGIVGLAEGGNRKGDELGVYGTAAFVREGQAWRMVAVALPEHGSPPAAVPAGSVAAVQPRPRERPPPTPLEQALEQLIDLTRHPVHPTMGPGERDAILLEEIGNATQSARQRLERAADVIKLAFGPPAGAYAETRNALVARAAAARVPLETVGSEGSVANVRLLQTRVVEFALVQNDVARVAHAGRGRFAGAPQSDLRAVASLFPEAVHLVAAGGRGIAGVADLRGKRVNLGAEGSGTRANALAVLAAHGLAPDALAAAAAQELPEALQALARGELDAVFGTIHAPAREVQRAFAASALALVPIGPSPELVDAGLVPLTLPSRTYPGQDGPVPTVAATALVVARADVPDAQVEALLALLFQRREGAATAAVSRIGLATARTGVTIPWHPRADAWLAQAGARGTPAPETGKPAGTAPVPRALR